MTPQARELQDWLAALREISPQNKREWIKRTLRSKSKLHIFGAYFFPHIIKGETPDCHIDLIRELATPVDSGIIFPRGFAKSTWEKIDTIHDIVYALEPVILYVSDTAQSAGFHFESIKGELEGNDSLRLVYGNLVPLENDELTGKARITRHFLKWTNNHFETLNGVNVVSRGAGNGRGVNIRNQRPTKVIIDDAETDDQVSSPVRRQKYHDWLYNVIIPSLDKQRGRIKVIGTVIHPECEVLKFYKANGGIFRKAIEGVVDNNLRSGKSIWPTYMTIEFLIKRMEAMGTRAFMQEYMNEPTNAELARINPLWIDEHIFTHLPADNKTKLNKVITMDPQSGESSSADEYAITVVAWYTGDRHRYVLEQKAGRASQMQQAIEFIRTWQDHPTASIVGIEKVLAQVAVFQIVLDWKVGLVSLPGITTPNRNIPLKALTPSGKDKLARFEKHEAMIERGELHIKPDMRILREQILFIGTNTLDHDDRVDSLIMGLDLTFMTSGGARKTAGMGRKSPTIAGNLKQAKF